MPVKLYGKTEKRRGQNFFRENKLSQSYSAACVNFFVNSRSLLCLKMLILQYRLKSESIIIRLYS